MTADSNGAELREGVSAKTDELASQLLGKALDVLAVGEEGAVKVGAPVVEGATVVGKVIKHGKGKKLNILTYRPKKGSMVRKGHRQPYTKVEITAING